MRVEVLYFARLRETFGTSRETLELPDDVNDVAGLVTWLRERGGTWAEELAAGRSFRVAVDQDMATSGTPLQAGAEVAIFPPVTGG